MHLVTTLPEQFSKKSAFHFSVKIKRKAEYGANQKTQLCLPEIMLTATPQPLNFLKRPSVADGGGWNKHSLFRPRHLHASVKRGSGSEGVCNLWQRSLNSEGIIEGGDLCNLDAIKQTQLFNQRRELSIQTTRPETTAQAWHKYVLTKILVFKMYVQKHKPVTDGEKTAELAFEMPELD